MSEITKFLAEKIGWELYGDDDVPLVDNAPFLSQNHGIDYRIPFDPMNNIAHAFMVVEKMRDNWIIEICLDGSWDCTMANYPNAGIAEADTAQKAICHAAVRALGTDEQIERLL